MSEDIKIPSVEAKLEVAMLAAENIPGGCTMGIGAGSTIKLTCLEMERRGIHPVHITTTSLDVSPLMKNLSTEIELVGGTYRRESNSTLPSHPERVFQEHSTADICLFSPYHVAVRENRIYFSFPNRQEAEWIRALIGFAGQRLIILNIYSRLGAIGPNPISYSPEELAGHRHVQLITNNLADWSNANPAPRPEAASTLKAFSKLGDKYSVHMPVRASSSLRVHLSAPTQPDDENDVEGKAPTKKK